MFLMLVVPIASLSPPNPPEMAGHHPYPQPPTTSAVLLSLVILHFSSLSQILFLIFLSLAHSLYHRFLSYFLLLPPTPPPLSLRTFANPSPTLNPHPSFSPLPTPVLYCPWRLLMSPVPDLQRLVNHILYKIKCDFNFKVKVFLKKKKSRETEILEPWDKGTYQIIMSFYLYF